MSSQYVQSCYLTNALVYEKRKKIIRNTITCLKKVMKKKPFRAIACRGMSGAIIAAIVANRMNLDLIVIRKMGTSHSYHDLEGPIGVPYVIIDDFMDTGKTLETIIEVTLKHRFSIQDCIGVYLYNTMEYSRIVTKYKIKLLNYSRTRTVKIYRG